MRFMLSLCALILILGACDEKDKAGSRQIKLTFESEPAGATVTHKGNPWPVGKTPLVHKMARTDGTQVFAFRLEGYEPMTREIVPDKDQIIRVQLKADPAGK